MTSFSPLWIRHCSLARLPAFAATLQSGQSGCSTVSVLPMQMRDGAGFRVCPAELLFLFHQMTSVPWLGARSGPEKEVKSMCMPAARLPPVCVCVFRGSVFIEPNVTLCVFSWRSLNPAAATLTMLPGSGLGVLPFTVNPVTTTGSTNCDTGTSTLHCPTYHEHLASCHSVTRSLAISSFV